MINRVSTKIRRLETMKPSLSISSIMGFQLLVDSYVIYNNVKRFWSQKEMTVGLRFASELQMSQKNIGFLMIFKEQIPTKRKSIRTITDTFIYLYHNAIFYIALSML